MFPNASPKTYTSSFNSHLPLTLAFGHSHTPTSFYLICRVDSSGPGQGPTSYSVSFVPQHTEVYSDQRHFQIPVRSARLLSLVTAVSKKNSFATVYLTVFSTTLIFTITFCLKNKSNTEILKFVFCTNPMHFNDFSH